MGITQQQLANQIKVPYQRVNEFVNQAEALHQVRHSGYRKYLEICRLLAQFAAEVGFVSGSIEEKRKSLGFSSAACRCLRIDQEAF